MNLEVETENLFDSLIAYGHKIFIPMRTKGSRHIGLKATLNDYNVKVYDKAKQFHLPQQVVRVEVHIGQHVSRILAVDSLACLTNVDILRHLGCELSKTTKRIVYDDPLLPMGQLNPSQQAFVQRGRNPRYYEKFTLEERKRFRRILSSYDRSGFSGIITKAVHESWETQLSK